MCKEKDFDERPWGNYRVLFRDQSTWVKRITVKSNQRLSLQKHEHRSENWIVVQGAGEVVLGDKSVLVKQGSMIEIKKGEAHRMENNGAGDLIFIEVALGEVLSEDDIIRLSDDYGR